VFEVSLFWLVATATSLLALAFAFKSRSRGRTRDERRNLTRSQERDNWVLCAVVWTAILTDKSSARGALALAGVAVLLWIASRTWKRYRLLGPG
jgi:threonine/homoserine/homoserine lactone efflux protein